MACIATSGVRTNNPMVAPVPSHARIPELRLAAFGVLAVLLHALLLLLPSPRVMPPAEALRHLSVSLQKTAPPPFSPRAAQEPAAAPAKAPRIKDEAGPAPDQATAAPPESPGLPSKVSTARLLDLAGRREWNIDAPPEKPRLGVPAPQPQPRNGRHEAPPAANLFDGAVLPERVAIVDRWRAADGSHNVVVNTPSGETYCGRAEAWSPTNPLFEPIMTWRPCGGGGKRSFQVPRGTGRATAETDRP